MFAAPAGVVLDAIKAGGLIARHPPADRLFINQQDAPRLSIAVTLRHQNQGMVTLAFRQLRPAVFIPLTRLRVIFFSQHTSNSKIIILLLL